MPTKVIMPQLGESVVEGTISKWLVKEGDSVNEFDPLLEVNTDKVDSEIPSPASGIVLKILVQEGETVNAGTTLAWIGESGEEIPSSEQTVPHQEVSAPTQPITPSQKEVVPGRNRDLGFISPVVAKLAAEHNIDLHQIKGTGHGGRITKKDVLAYIEQSQTEATVPIWETPADGDLFRPTELVFQEAKQDEPPSSPKTADDYEIIPLTPVRRRIAEHMVHSKHTSPHVTTVMEADLSQVIAHRETNKAQFAKQGVRLTFTPYFVAATVMALKAYPVVNSSWSEQGIIVHKHINIGMATSLGKDGLIVPVIKNAETLSLFGIAKLVNTLAEKARAKKLSPDDVTGGTFSITNHGISGSLFASPIINQPQCAILGVGAIQKRVVVIDDAIAIRPMVYLSLTFDHRILDGAVADNFLNKVVESLENWSKTE